MATISFGAGLGGVSMSVALWPVPDQADSIVATATVYQVVYPDGMGYDKFTGTGFTYDENTGLPAGGTITAWTFVAEGVTLLSITGLNLPVATFMSYFEAAQTTPDESWTQLMEFVLDGKDTITGTADLDELLGYGGNDVIKGGAGTDDIYGGDGNDTITGDADEDVLRGEAGDDTIDGGTGFDELQGGDGNDKLTGGADDDILSGGADNDILDGGADNDTLSGDGGDDVLKGGAGDDTIDGGDGNDLLDGGTGIDFMAGGAGNDTYTAQEDDQIEELADGGTDTVNMTFTTPDFVFDMMTIMADVENFNILGSVAGQLLGTDKDNILVGNSASNTLQGREGDDELRGGGGNDELYADIGNDILDGGAGNDFMSGGSGNDTYYIDSAGDHIEGEEVESDTNDVVYSSVTYTLSEGLEQLTLQGNKAINGTGNDGDNLLVGNDGANLLDGGAGNDTMVGGKGNDTYIVDNADDSVDEAVAGAAGGIDLVKSSIGFDLGSNSNLENLTLTGPDDVFGYGNDGANIILGNEGSNELLGRAGKDTLEGGAGDDLLNGEEDADILKGGAGDDLYIVNIVNSGGLGKLEDTLTEAAGEGNDTIELRETAAINPTTIVLAANFENLDASQTGAIKLNLTGNAADNTLTANNEGSTLDGATGNDELYGGGGNDTLIGGAGNDLLAGGAGNDVYKLDQADQIMEENNEGDDTVEMTTTVANVTFDLAADFANIENFKLMSALAGDIVGTTADNVLTGNGAVNYLSGGEGFDTLNGGGGNDTLDGGDQDDILDGGDGDDLMMGGTGDDIYIVGSLKDQIQGEVDGGGVDTVKSTVSFTLADFLEKLVLQGAGNINGTGNDEANEIYGNEGANILDGGAGDDVLEGGKGNDTYIIDSNAEAVIETIGAGGGIDLVMSSVDFDLEAQANIENLTLTGKDSIYGYGNEFANIIIGNEAANELSGDKGKDTLDGGAGDDTLTGGDDADILKGGTGSDTYVVNMILAGKSAKLEDTITELAGDAGDTLVLTGEAATSAVTKFVLGATLENLDASQADVQFLDLAGNAAANEIIGNDYANVIDGGAGNDTLEGQDGDDTLIDGAGEDKLRGGDGNDVYKAEQIDNIFEAVGEGEDTIEMTPNSPGSTFDVDDYGEIEHFTLVGKIAGDIAGDGGDNRLTGNAAANILMGGDGNDTLAGGAGNDELIGGVGNDILDGGTGNDKLAGGEGNDTYIVDSLKDTVDETGGDGIDTLKSSVLPIATVTDIENYTYTGKSAWTFTGDDADNVITGGAGVNKLTGGDGDDRLIGNVGNDILTGGAGNDIMEGGLGNDTFYFDDADDEIVENASAGTDTVIASVHVSLDGAGFEHVENLTFTAGLVAPAAPISGNALNNIINAAAVGASVSIDGGDGKDTITGSAFADELNGGLGNDTLIGGAGNDDLIGGAGVDVLQGGAGDDLYVVNLAQVGSGASASVKLEDTVTEAAGSGRDSIVLHGSFDLDKAATLTVNANVENFSILNTGATKLHVTGNGLDNTIVGNEADNIINGGTGNDYLVGGSGNDTLIGGAGNDTFAFDTLDDGKDVIKDFNLAQDKLYFGGIIDANDDDSIIEEFNEALANDDAFIVDEGVGKNVVISFSDGGVITLEKIGTGAGNIEDITDIFSASQILGA